jgi:hypothetical protein
MLRRSDAPALVSDHSAAPVEAMLLVSQRSAIAHLCWLQQMTGLTGNGQPARGHASQAATFTACFPSLLVLSHSCCHPQSGLGAHTQDPPKCQCMAVL